MDRDSLSVCPLPWTRRGESVVSGEVLVAITLGDAAGRTAAAYLIEACNTYPVVWERVSELEAEVARLEHWVNDLQAGCWINCVYCGHRFGPDPGTPVAMADVLREHIEQCPQHPLAQARRTILELQSKAHTVLCPDCGDPAPCNARDCELDREARLALEAFGADYAAEPCAIDDLALWQRRNPAMALEVLRAVGRLFRPVPRD